MDVVFILNGIKKKGAKVHDTIKIAQSDPALNCILLESTCPKESISLAKRSADSGAEVIIAVGGDGTCNEVINGIQKSINREKVIFGIIPNGSGNDFHRMLGSFSSKIFIDALKTRKIEVIDIVKMIQKSNLKYALNVTGVGFDGFVVNKLSQIRDKSILKGKVAYAYSILHSFFLFNKPKVIISSKEFNYSGEMMMTTVCNGTTFGHGLVVSPTAKLSDGKLSVTFFGKVSLMDYVKNISRLKKGQVIHHPEVHYFETEEIKIQKISEEMYLETDGEIVGEGSVLFHVVPKALNLLCPSY